MEAILCASVERRPESWHPTYQLAKVFRHPAVYSWIKKVRIFGSENVPARTSPSWKVESLVFKVKAWTLRTHIKSEDAGCVGHKHDATYLR